jgi:hypothetical protein
MARWANPYGMKFGTVGFLMNQYRGEDLGTHCASVETCGPVTAGDAGADLTMPAW